MAKKKPVEIPIEDESLEATEAPEVEKESPKENDADIIALAKSRYQAAEDFEADNRKEALADIKFRSGDQWPADIRKQRELEKRPCLTINRMPQYTRAIINEQRQNRPAIQISPYDSVADPATAKVIQGLIRNIWNVSNGDVAIDTAFQGAVDMSFGFFRIMTDYCDPMSFDQQLIIKKVANHFSCYLDANSTEPDGSDANHGFVGEKLSKDEFKAQYPDAKLNSESDWTSIGDDSWISKESVRVLEYFTKEFKKVSIVQYSNGLVLEASNAISIPEGVKETNRREALVPKIKWYLIAGNEILDRSELDVSWIPLIPVYGDTLVVDGKVIRESAIRHSKDSQMAYNFFVTAETEAIGLTPKAPYIGAVGQFTGLESQWDNANTTTAAFLEYNQVTSEGIQAPPPQRNAFEAPIAAITSARMQAADDIKATTGIHDASLGARGNENSGVAIQRRNMQSQTSNFHLVDNLARSIKHAGRILIDWIPHIYDAPRAERIIGEDGQEELVQLNKIFEKGGKQVSHMMNIGKYDVVVDTGPSHQTKRQEAVAAMMDFAKAMPEKAGMIADLMVKNMDWAGGKEIAERLKKLLPPELMDDKDKPPVDPAMQAQIQQMDQVIQQLQQQLGAATDQNNLKHMELESKEKIELMKLEQNTVVELAKINHKATETLFAAELQRIDQQLQQLQQPNLENQSFSEPGNQAAVPNDGVM